MKVTPKTYANSLFESTLGKDDYEVKKIVDNFTDLLIKNNDLSKARKVTQIFSSLWNKENGIIESEVISARKLDTDSLNSIKDFLITQSKAKKILVKEKINKDILGGVIIKYDDKILDNSLKTKIKDLNMSIKS